MKKHHILIIIWVSFMVIITYWAMIPNGGAFLAIGKEKPWMFRHFLTFLVFVPLTKFTFPKLNYLYLFLISFGFGLLIEILQHYLTNGVREFNLANLALDLVGIAVGMGIVSLRSKVKSLKTNE
jgi:VanZ family protein